MPWSRPEAHVYNSVTDMFISPFGLNHLATVRDNKRLALQGLPTLKEARTTCWDRMSLSGIPGLTRR